MEDKFDNVIDYGCDVNDSDDENDISSSGDEKDEFDLEYFLTTDAGKDVLKEKDNKQGKAMSYTDKITLGETVTKDNLLYDPDIDKQNQEWIDKKRNKHSVGNQSKAIKSDALLCCPGCMVTVCVDCQRHDLYKTQFRAMFVMNCYIVADEILKYESKNKSKKRRKKEGPGKLVPVDMNSEDTLESSNAELELYNPVKCDCCNTELAVYDKNEIYHFHNVLESLS